MDVIILGLHKLVALGQGLRTIILSDYKRYYKWSLVTQHLLVQGKPQGNRVGFRVRYRVIE